MLAKKQDALSSPQSPLPDLPLPSPISSLLSPISPFLSCPSPFLVASLPCSTHPSLHIYAPHLPYCPHLYGEPEHICMICMRDRACGPSPNVHTHRTMSTSVAKCHETMVHDPLFAGRHWPSDVSLVSSPCYSWTQLLPRTNSFVQGEITYTPINHPIG